MLIVVDPHSGVPVYRQIVDQVRFQVAAGVVAAGEELPSTRALSQELGVNPMTVSKAYVLLEEEGLVERRPGLPLIVSDDAAADVGVLALDQLSAVMQPAARAAVQLGVEESEAVDLFRRLLEAAREQEQR